MEIARDKLEDLMKWQVGIDWQLKRLTSDIDNEKQSRAEAQGNIFKQIGAIENEVRTVQSRLLEKMDDKLEKTERVIKDELIAYSRNSKEIGDKRDTRIDNLVQEIHTIKNKIALATGIVIAIQFSAPYIIALVKGFKP